MPIQTLQPRTRPAQLKVNSCNQASTSTLDFVLACNESRGEALSLYMAYKEKVQSRHIRIVYINFTIDSFIVLENTMYSPSYRNLIRNYPRKLHRNFDDSIFASIQDLIHRCPPERTVANIGTPLVDEHTWARASSLRVIYLVEMISLSTRSMSNHLQTSRALARRMNWARSFSVKTMRQLK
jgi:hypothetical protein